MTNKKIIFSIGHSNYQIQTLLEKLAQNSIEVLIDIRSKPTSRWCPQFNKQNLCRSLTDFGIKYEWRGANLGGLKENIMYPETIQELSKRCETETICLMCTEREPENCHRSMVIEPELNELGIKVKHILYD